MGPRPHGPAPAPPVEPRLAKLAHWLPTGPGLRYEPEGDGFRGLAFGGPQVVQTRTPPRPPWVRTVTLSYPRTGKTFDAPVIDDVAGLVWAVNLTTLELHPFLLEACTVALLLRDRLTALGLSSYPKTSGGKGLHVYVPVTGATYERTKSLARRLAGELSTSHPDLVVDRMTKSLHRGKVLVDWSQNDPGKSTVAPWSARGQQVPSVSMPVTWDEVEHATRRSDADPMTFTIADAAARASRADLFAPVAAGGQRI